MVTNRCKQNLQHSRGCYVSLACSIGSISIACGSLLQMNSTSDRIPLQRGLFLASLGFVYFISLTDFFNKYFLETRQGIQFRRKYRLMVSDVMDITNKIVSAIQAAFSCLAGFIVCKSSCSKSFLYASHFVMEGYAWFGTAYFMYDIWSMYKVHTHKISDKLKIASFSMKSQFLQNVPTITAKTTQTPECSNTNDEILYNNHTSNTSINDISPISADICHLKKHEDENDFDYGEYVELPKDGRWDFFKYIITHPIMVMHHIFIGTFGLLVVTYLRGDFGDCVYSFIYLMEFSTPFVSVRSILSTLGMKSSRTYIINGLVMLGTFFLCRILMWPYVLYWYSEAVNLPFFQAIAGLPRGCKISITILFLPQIYWFSLMLKGALKVFLPKKIPKETKNNNLSTIGENISNNKANCTDENNTAKKTKIPTNDVQNTIYGRSLL